MARLTVRRLAKAMRQMPRRSVAMLPSTAKDIDSWPHCRATLQALPRAVSANAQKAGVLSRRRLPSGLVG